VTSRRCGGWWRLGQGGFTLAEIIIACAVIGVGLVSASYAFTVGIQNVETGRQQTTAVFLAEQRMEQVKAAAAKASEPPLAYLTAGNFPADAYDSISGSAKFRRTVTLTTFTAADLGTPSGGIRVDVDVFYRQITAKGVSTSTERSVRLSHLFGSR
jgi:prepilin-type N-terminal cleavage/methylation domain-containing protein